VRRTILWLLAFASISYAGNACAHEPGPVPVIVDTDAGLDDIRALALVAQSGDFSLVAVVTSDGSCTPEAGARNVRRALRALGLADVPVGAGESSDAPAPFWRPTSESLGWTATEAPEKTGEPERYPAAISVIARALQSSGTPVAYLCLGPFTNLAAALRNDGAVREGIGIIYYSGSSPEARPLSWNTERDLGAARYVFGADIPLRAIRLPDDVLPRFDADLLESVRRMDTPAARFVASLHNDERVLALVREGHFRCWDETAALALVASGVVACDSAGGANIRLATAVDADGLRYWYTALLSGDPSASAGGRKPVILSRYPVSGDLLQTDVREFAPEIIERHGLEEWHAALLTNELHRHLGAYSLIGAKMGIRAREILGAGVDELSVVSYAGSEPPLSCLTDGLQVATGASLGRGAITVDPKRAEPAALFMAGSRRLTLRLSPEVAARIAADLRDAVARHGNLTPDYWRSVREMSLRYWLEMDRSRIFVEDAE
jgi:pyrimidine-specific ribonucleoside hydrolase